MLHLGLGPLSVVTVPLPAL